MSKDKSARKSKLSTIEGRVIQWLDRISYKQLLLATSQGEVQVKLSKALRHSLISMVDRQNILGTWVRLSGSYQKDGEYKAEELFIHLANNLSDTRSELPQQTKSLSLEKTSPACILVCGKSSCQRRGAGAVIASLQENISDQGLKTQVKIKTTGCLKKCKQGVNVVFLPDKTSYTQVKPIQVSSLVTKHFPSSPCDTTSPIPCQPLLQKNLISASSNL